MYCLLYAVVVFPVTGTKESLRNIASIIDIFKAREFWTIKQYNTNKIIVA